MIDTDAYYIYPTGMIVCGECFSEDLARTEAGEFTGDEAVTLDMGEKIHDADDEAYQCDNCLKQSAGYEKEWTE